jgi:DNA-directed RNA polymerase subunit alpha
MFDFTEVDVSDDLTIDDDSIKQAEIDSTPSISVETNDELYGKFIIEPLPPGFGVTLANPLRRALFSSVPGTAVTWVKIDGILHEYTSIPNIKEEVTEFLLNVKGIRIRSAVDRPGKLRLAAAGQGSICAGDIMASSDFEVVNPEHHLATLDSEDSNIEIEFNVERGSGFTESVINNGAPVGVLPVDALFSPVRKVSYDIEQIRVGRKTNYEKLVVELWTDGTIAPIDAIKYAGNVLLEHFFLFAKARVNEDGSAYSPSTELQISPDQYDIAVETLDLSSRTLNCLKRASLHRVGEVLELKKEDLLKIRNFGEKSLNEIYGKLSDLGLTPPDQTIPEIPEKDVEDEA